MVALLQQVLRFIIRQLLGSVCILPQQLCHMTSESILLLLSIFHFLDLLVKARMLFSLKKVSRFA